MKYKILIIFTMCFLSNCIVLKGQISKKEICYIYSKIIYDLQDYTIKEYKQKKLFLNKDISLIDDFVYSLKVLSPLFENELEKRNIDYKKFINKTESINLDSCFNKKIKLIDEGTYRNKKYNKKSKGICYISNIAYYDNFAFVRVNVELSYGRRYSNFYFFQKYENWNIIYSKEGCD